MNGLSGELERVERKITAQLNDRRHEATCSRIRMVIVVSLKWFSGDLRVISKWSLDDPQMIFDSKISSESQFKRSVRLFCIRFENTSGIALPNKADIDDWN